jgi:hypothetical protein
MEGLFREDPLHMMQLLFYFGLLIFSLGEAAIAASIVIPDDVLIRYLPSTTRMFGMIFLLLGVLNYVRATDKVLGFINIKVWVFLIVLCSLTIVFIITGIYFEQSTTSIIVIFNLMIFTLGMGIMTGFIFYLLWLFRNGKLRGILLAISSFLFLMLIRSIVIAHSTNSLMELISLAFALESYVCVLASESLYFQLLD